MKTTVTIIAVVLSLALLQSCFLKRTYDESFGYFGKHRSLKFSYSTMKARAIGNDDTGKRIYSTFKGSRMSLDVKVVDIYLIDTSGSIVHEDDWIKFEALPNQDSHNIKLITIMFDGNTVPELSNAKVGSAWELDLSDEYELISVFEK